MIKVNKEQSEHLTTFTEAPIQPQQPGGSQIKNDVFPCYYDIMGPLAKQYPVLSKTVFLIMLLQQSAIIYTPHKAHLKDVWKRVCEKLTLKDRSYHCNEHTKPQDIFKIQTDKTWPYLLYNGLSLDNSIANSMTNYVNEQVIIDVQPLKNPPNSSFLHEEFGLCFVGYQEDEFEEFVMNLNLSEKNSKALENHSNKASDTKQLMQAIKRNIQIADSMKEEEGFLKVYLNLIKGLLAQKEISISNSRWKNACKYLKIIGLNKSEGRFKVLSLVDCLFMPNCLATTLQQFELISEANQHALRALIPVYGAAKFAKHLDDHFWISKRQKELYKRIVERFPLNTPSFFYPCNKFANYVSICFQYSRNGNIIPFYKICGSDKKLMSDRYIEVDPQKRYRLEFDIRNSHKMLVYLGLACYDENKRFINTIQICRRPNTDVKVIDFTDNKNLVVDEESKPRLANWVATDSENSFVYLRSIGVYSDGNTERLLPIEGIICDQENVYDLSPEKGAYSNINEQAGTITLNPKAAQRVKEMIAAKQLVKGVTTLMNHYEAGTYVIGRIINDRLQEWTKCPIEFSGEARESAQDKFLESTRFVRIVVMSNFNSGYPDFKIQSKEADLSISNLAFYQVL